MNPARFEKRLTQLGSRLADLADANRMAEEQAREAIRNMGARESARAIQTLGQDQPALYVCRNCLNGGEIAPDMGARFDQQRYNCGCHSLLNMCPLPTGGITKRPGMIFLGWSGAREAGKRCRLIPFVFSASSSRILEICENGKQCEVRVWMPDGRLAGGAALKLPFSMDVGMEFSYTQSADVIFIAHKDISPGKIMRYGDNDWRYETIRWTPSIQAPEWDDVGPAGNTTSGENRRVTLEYCCTAVDGETGEESAPGPVWKIRDQHPLNDSRVMEVRPAAVPGASEYRVYKKSAGVFGYIGRITEPDEDGRLTFRDNNIAPDTEDTPPEIKNPFEGRGNYPSVVFLHQQRLGYAASANKPLTVWLSQSGNFESMAASVPPDADDAIEATLAASQANSILWAVSDRTGLAIGTEGGEWMMQPSEGSALTPSDLSFQPQTNYGSQPGPGPVRADSGILFCQRGGHVVRHLGYSFQDDRYNASDLSILARHMLADAAIVSWCWQQEPYGILWAALDNGTLAALTWLREHDVIGWHRHETAGKVESVATIPGPDGRNALFLTVVRETLSGKWRSVEMLGDFGNATEQTRHLDGPEKLEFNCRCVPCLPESSLNNGSTYLAVRKINAVKVQTLNSRPFKARVVSQTGGATRLMDVPPRGASFSARANWACPLGAGWREDSRLELVLDGPDPATILGISITLELGDEHGGQE